MALLTISRPLYLDATTFHTLLKLQGPSLGLWRAAEIAVLREQVYGESMAPARGATTNLRRPILDLGCGDGLVTSQVLQRVEIGLDPDEKVLKRTAQTGIYERFEAVPAEEMRLPDASIGTVVSNSVLEHLPRLDAVLEAVARVLRPGGRLIFTVPTEAFSKWLVLPVARYSAWRNTQLCHLNLWPVERWVSHLERVGLEVEEVRPYLRHELVSMWDTLELLQQIWVFHRRLVSIVWQRIPPLMLERMAYWASHMDLSAAAPGGGRLVVARKR
jgi:SAM-dependent methyltransferase